MSQELHNQIVTLKAENENLKNQAAHNTQGIHSLMAQLDAHKQQLNESFSASLNLRTHLILAQKAHKELTDSSEELKKKIAALENPVCQ